MLTLDHIAVLGETLAAATAQAEAVLGCPLGPGGSHARYGTHNRLLGLAPGLYLEAIAVDPEAPPPQGARWFGLDGFRGPARLDKWICRVPDMTAALRVLPMAGRPVHLSRGDLRWTMAVPDEGLLPYGGLFPALIQWHSDPIPGQSLPASQRRLQRLTVTHPRAGALQAVLSPYLVAPQVTFETGDTPGLRAQIATPDGTVLLT